MSLINKLKLSFLNDELEPRVKTSFWATDSEKPLFDLYHAWIGTPSTNPIEDSKLIMFTAAKMIELALVNKLVESGEAKKLHDQFRIEFTYKDIKVSGYLDSIDKDGNPVEIKTFYGDYQARELQLGKPKTSYLKQLAIYMYATNTQKGTLLYMDRGLGDMYEFVLTRKDEYTFCYGDNETFSLLDVFERWNTLWNEHIAPRIEPKPDFRYKTPIEKIDWQKVSKSNITEARMGRKVIGDWQVLYSPYKNLYVERENTCLGYSPEEVEKIKVLTKGFSSIK